MSIREIPTKVAGNGKAALLAAVAALALLGGCLKAGDGLGLDASGKPVPFCQANPEDPSCIVVDPCIADPSGPGCTGDPCKTDPSGPGCKPDTCKTNPPAPGCSVDVCKVNPADPSCAPVPAKVKFSAVLPILKDNCQQCHTTGGSGYVLGKLNLSDDSAFASLVQAPAANQSVAPGWVRVKPGSPDSSILHLKVSMASPKLPNGKTYGQPMPVGKPALPAATVAVIKQWIADGAEK